MTLLDRYLSVRFVGMLFRTLLALVALYVLVDLLVERLQQVDKHGVAWSIVLQYYISLLPYILVQYVAPFGALMAGLFVFGETAQNNEITAALAGGISLRRFVLAPLVIALIFSIALFAIQETMGIAGYRRANELNGKYFSGESDTKREPVTWANLQDGWTCHILKFNRVALTGEGVVAYSRQGGLQQLIEANSIFWDEEQNRWVLRRGRHFVFDTETQSRTARRITQAPAPFSETPEQLFSLERAPEEKGLKTIVSDLAYARSRGMYCAPLEVKFHTRFSQPMLSFVMILLAVPFGMRIRRGGLAVSFGAAIAVAVIYLLLFFVSAGLGNMGRLPAFVAAWLASTLFVLTGIFLLVKTPT